MMSKGLTLHSKNAYTYKSKDAYLRAAEVKVGRKLSDIELQYLDKEATTRDGVKGSSYVWNTDTYRLIGTFSVCDHCFSSVRENNDVVTILTPRVGRGTCNICGFSDRTLRKIAVDNYGKVASFMVKTAEVYNRGTIVTVVDAPSRFNALIGELAEVVDVQMSPTRGIRYTIELENGFKVPYEFSPSHLELAVEGIDVNESDLQTSLEDYDTMMGNDYGDVDDDDLSIYEYDDLEGSDLF